MLVVCFATAVWPSALHFFPAWLYLIIRTVNCAICAHKLHGWLFPGKNVERRHYCIKQIAFFSIKPAISLGRSKGYGRKYKNLVSITPKTILKYGKFIPESTHFEWDKKLEDMGKLFIKTNSSRVRAFRHKLQSALHSILLGRVRQCCVLFNGFEFKFSTI